jgi:hypothetical protein
MEERKVVQCKMPTLEQRVAELEEKVARLTGEKPEVGQQLPWWDKWFGAFKDDPDFDEAVRLGAEYRKSQPNAADKL